LLQFDEEEYESLDGEMLAPKRDVLATLLKKSLEAWGQAAATTRPGPNTQPNRQMPENIPPQNTFPRQAKNLPAVQMQPSDEYNSDEYESIKENVSA